MYLHTLQLLNFKNYVTEKLELSEKINVLVGKNGCGKTNFLDAVHFLSLTKSAFNSSDHYAIRQGEKFFSVKAEFRVEGKSRELLCAVQSGAKKIFTEDGREYQKLSDHIGKYPVVMIAPDDNELVKEGSEERRKFFDTIISQLDKRYLESLIRYNQVLRQRNSLLKMFAETRKVDLGVLDSYDAVLIETGSLIFKKRQDFTGEFLPFFKRFYNYIVDDEQVGLQYASELLNISYEDGLAKYRDKDLFLQRSNFGVHRDDFLFTINNGELKRLGSQGQQKSFIIALKLAQFQMVKHHKGLKPILLLDDIFDKLDDHRIEKMLELIKNEEFGQLFITDARPERTGELLKKINAEANVLKVENGKIVRS